jgi:beta-mannanase
VSRPPSEHGERGRGPAALLASAAVPVLLVLAIALLVAGQLQSDGSAPNDVVPDDPLPEERASPRPGVPVEPNSRAELMLGVTTGRLARNSFTPWGAKGLASVAEFERDAHAHASVVMWYADWANVHRPDLDQLRAVAQRGSLPEITWEPWDHAKGLWVPQPAFRLRRIIEGRYDALIRRWARDLAAYEGPVRLRFAHEMNGNWYPWAESFNGNRPGEFAMAWRRVWRIFAEEGADNVEWVWSPVVPGVKKTEFPGRQYVDRLGLSGFVGGVILRFRPWRSFERAFGHALRVLKVLGPGKPIELSEVGVAERGGDKPAWIRGMFRALTRTPEIDTLIWFNVDKGSDWRIESSAASVRAFQAGARAPRVGQKAARFTLTRRAAARQRRLRRPLTHP